MSQVSDYLVSLPHVKNVSACRVTIGKQAWEGARYTQVHKYTSDMQGVQDGRFKAGDEYERVAIYLIGKRPDLKRHCFPFDGHDWYIACHTDPSKPIAPEHQQYHPFGHSFVLMPWDLPNSIDQYEPKPYHRIPMTVDTE